MKTLNVPHKIFEQAIKNNKTRLDLLKELNITSSIYRKLIKKYNIELPKWDRSYYRRTELVTKICKCCEKEFKVKNNKYTAKQQTCSKSCYAKHFRGRNANHYSEGKSIYRQLCFDKFGKKCLMCNEVEIIEVHHIDRNRNNNEANNLVPLCPTHHKYAHTKRLAYLVENKINLYKKE